MQKRVIETISGRNLCLLIGSLVFGQIFCWVIIDSFITSSPATKQTVYGVPCKDDVLNHTEPNQNKWYYPRGEGACEKQHKKTTFKNLDYDVQTVYAFQIPSSHNESNPVQGFSRQQKNLVGSLQIIMNMDHQPENVSDPKMPILLKARLAYRNNGDKDDDWKLYASSMKIRHLECKKIEDVEHQYQCESIPLMELTTLYHNFYLINLRLLFDDVEDIKGNLGYTHDVILTVFSQSEEQTEAWIWFKITLCYVVIFVLIWYMRRNMKLMPRPSTLLEDMLFLLGFGMLIQNVPLDSSVFLNISPALQFLFDIKECFFYGILFVFWVVFMGEHAIEDGAQRSTMKSYGIHIVVIFNWCMMLFSFYLLENINLLQNPFLSIWIKNGYYMTYLFHSIFVTLAILYVMYLSWMFFKVVDNIKAKKEALEDLHVAYRLHYKKILKRFSKLVFCTLMCAILVIVGFYENQNSEGPLKWTMQSTRTSLISIAIYGVLNTYVITLLCLYAPSNEDSSTPEHFELNMLMS